MMATLNLSRDQFYDLYKKLQFRVLINSVVKGRHASSEKVCMEYLEVSAEPHNPLDNKAFIVAHVLPGPSGPVYGRVPKGLQELFYNVDIFSNETGTVYELWCKPTVDKDEPSKPSRWSRGGGLEQPCQYVIWVGRLILEKVKKDLEELDIPYQVEEIEHAV
ncbi:uncharacterized protein LOC134727264 [Mytilus trossulus]|uniref:uncharacterized protein LOC134727264 n=1 Tax=Mytilus trossulus TaxID=6551 RepID=UPI003007B4C4